MNEWGRNDNENNSQIQDERAEPDQAGGGQDNRRTVILEEKPQKRGRRGLKIFLIVLAVLLVLVLIGVVSFSGSEDYEADGPYIATIYVEGTIQDSNVDSLGRAVGYQHDWTLYHLDWLMEDGNNKGLILFVDSPGGGVYESDELYLKIKEYQEKTENPVYSYMGSMAASGGYYISAPADKIFANRNTWTGSIGITIGTMYDVSGFLERYGIKTETITSGKNKAMGSAVDPMSPEQKAIWQGLVDESYDQFTQIVAEGRGIPIGQVKKIADGRIYSAKQALELRLIDAIGTFDEAVADMRETYDLKDCEVMDMTYQTPSLWKSLLQGNIPWKETDERMMAGTEAGAVLSLVQKESGFPISYTCQWLTK